MSYVGFDVVVGWGMRRHMRDLLESEQFVGSSIEYREGKGWFTRVFTIKGNEEDVDRVQARIKHWMKCMGEKV